MDSQLSGYPSKDKPWEKYYTDSDRDIVLPKCTVFQNVYDGNKNFLKDVALNYYGNKISYGKLFSIVEKCAKSLRTIGIDRGDCVNLCTASVPEAIYIVLACSRIGAIANFINPLFDKAQMRDRINDTESEWIIILDAMYEFIREVLPETCIKNIVIVPATESLSPLLSKLLYLRSDTKRILNGRKRNGQDYISWKEFLTIGVDYTGDIDASYEKDTATIMVYSSGSTGASKGILLTNDGINAFVSAYKATGYSEMLYRGLTFLQMIPVWFSTGIVYSVLMPLANGLTVILEPKFSKETFAKDLKKYKPEMTLTATSLWLYIVNNDLKIDLSNMCYPVSGGEKILPLDEKRVNEYLQRNGCKKKFYKGYGMCELGSEVSGTTDVDVYSEKPGGCGYPMLNVIVAAFDISTNKELKYGEHGEIRVCSPARMKGYYKNTEATEEFFKTDDQGQVWGCTGDVGYIDEDGEVFVLGRANDHCCLEDGRVIFLFDIEEKIFDLPVVNQCKVVNTVVEDKKCLVAHLVLREGSSDKESFLLELYEYLKKSLPDYMVPSYYKIRQSMPVHNNGKRDVEALINDKDDLIPAIH